MSKLCIYLIAASLLMLGGCARNSGNMKMGYQNRAELSSMIIKGVTSTEDVRLALGDPNEVEMTDKGNQKWTYKHKRVTPKVVNYIPIVSTIASGEKQQTKILVILFDRNDRVVNYQFTHSCKERNIGFAPVID